MISGPQEGSLSHNAPQGTYIPLGTYPHVCMCIRVYKCLCGFIKVYKSLDNQIKNYGGNHD